jgi:hypothetical protein
MGASLPATSEQRVGALPVGWLAALAIGVLVVGTVLPRFQARPGATVAVVFPPWWSRDVALRAAMRADVAIVALGRMSNVVIVSAKSVHALAGLYQTGAWSLIGTDGAAGCSFSWDALRPVQQARAQ